MNRLQFIIVTSLSGFVALCVFFQIILVRLSNADDLRLSQTNSQIQQGQLCFTRSRQIASRVAQLGETQNDQALKDLLTRHGFKIRANTDSSAAPTRPAPATH